MTPTKEGVFEIPPIEVSAGGKVYRTSSLTLKVVMKTATTRTGRQIRINPILPNWWFPKNRPTSGNRSRSSFGFISISECSISLIHKDSILSSMGEGFVIKKYLEPTEKQLESNGRVYHVVVYKTGLTGVKPGKAGPAVGHPELSYFQPVRHEKRTRIHRPDRIFSATGR